LLLSLPGIASPGRPYNAIDGAVTPALPTASSISAAMRQEVAVRHRYSPIGSPISSTSASRSIAASSARTWARSGRT